ncbi:MAG: TPM domain-containing protein [Nonlabens sp.]|uniref:TPM domain-containing protein n=1 Tax=Nonlabens sp. TaxID=1888209 RepID=UPI003EF50EE6
MDSRVEDFLTTAQEQQVIAAIRTAERTTSGEIRVHLESHCAGDAYVRAQEIFHLLKMDNTKEENGILFYVAVTDRKFAIIGDKGIHKHVGDEFWLSIKELLRSRFRESVFHTGLIEAIHLTGKKLSQYYPWDINDTNELPDEITTS